MNVMAKRKLAFPVTREREVGIPLTNGFCKLRAISPETPAVWLTFEVGCMERSHYRSFNWPEFRYTLARIPRNWLFPRRCFTIRLHLFHRYFLLGPKWNHYSDSDQTQILWGLVTLGVIRNVKTLAWFGLFFFFFSTEDFRPCLCLTLADRSLN